MLTKRAPNRIKDSIMRTLTSNLGFGMPKIEEIVSAMNWFSDQNTFINLLVRKECPLNTIKVTRHNATDRIVKTGARIIQKIIEQSKYFDFQMTVRVNKCKINKTKLDGFRKTLWFSLEGHRKKLIKDIPYDELTRKIDIQLLRILNDKSVVHENLASALTNPNTGTQNICKMDNQRVKGSRNLGGPYTDV